MSKDDYKGIACFGIICIIIVVLAASYLVIAGLSYLICLGFGLVWTWLLALAVWAAIILLWVIAQIIK